MHCFRSTNFSAWVGVLGVSGAEGGGPVDCWVVVFRGVVVVVVGKGVFWRKRDGGFELG